MSAEDPATPVSRRTVSFSRFGPPSVLEPGLLPLPRLQPGEALVEVLASTVNPTDTLMRSGQQAALMEHLEPPYIDGCEFSGRVLALAPGDAASSSPPIGQLVMGIVNPRRPEGGSHAELIPAPVASLVPLHEGADPIEAATIPMNGLTALKSVEALGLLTEPSAGRSVLITGGAGAVGGYAIELAKRAGFTVVADAKPEDAGLLRGLGVDHLVSRGADMGGAVRDLYPDGVDGAIDTARIGETVAALVRDGGTLVGLRRSDLTDDPRIRTVYVGVFDHVGDEAALERLGEYFESGVLTPRVAATLPMSEAAEAHRRVEQGGLRGRVVLIAD